MEPHDNIPQPPPKYVRDRYSEQIELSQRYLNGLFGKAPDDHHVVMSYKPIQSNAWKGPERFSLSQVREGTAAARIVELADRRCQPYIRMTTLHQHTILLKGARGDATHAAGTFGLWSDIDHLGGEHKSDRLPTEDEALAFLHDMPWPWSMIVNSGGGFHAYLSFKEFIVFDTADEREAFAHLSRQFQHTILSWAHEKGWWLDNTSGLARLLRPAGSLNHKTQPPRPVHIIHLDPTVQYNPMDLEDWLLPAPQRVARSPTTPKADSTYAANPANLHLIAEACAFMAHCRDDAATLPEPHWFHGLNIIGHCQDGDEHAHDWSRPYPGYNPTETTRKLAHARETKPVTCAQLHEVTGGAWCQTCAHWSQIHSPIKLGYPKHGGLTQRDMGRTELDPEGLREKFGAFYSDVTSGGQFARVCGHRVRYVHAWKRWLIYENGIWVPDEQERIIAMAKALAADMGQEAKRWLSELLQVAPQAVEALTDKEIQGQADVIEDQLIAESRAAAKAAGRDDADAATCNHETVISAYRIELANARKFYRHCAAMPNRIEIFLALAQSEPSVPVSVDQLDQHLFKLVCKNGTLDLETGQLLPFNPDLLITRAVDVAYDPDAKAPRWERFLMEVMGAPRDQDHPDESAAVLEARAEAEVRARELVHYLQRVVGYCLTGSIKEHALFILHGAGSNGKSTLINVLMELLGPYAKKCTAELFMSKSGNEHPTERADLFGKRLAAATELEEGRRFNEAFIKECTGGDPITARRLYENYWTFPPTHKVWLATNHKPIIRDTSYGMWRRLHCIPFDVAFQKSNAAQTAEHQPKADINLEATLKGELPGILAWAVQGCLQWQQQGLCPPQVVQDTTEAYRVEQDIIERFIEECCFTNSSCTVSSSDLWQAFKTWAGDSGEYVGTQTAFGRRITAKGFERGKSSRTYYHGIGLLTQRS